jgi:hypothetical protein
VAQTEARWRGYGFDPVVAALSPYDEEAGTGIAALVEPLRAGGVGLLVLDCMGFRRPVKGRPRSLAPGPHLPYRW